MLVSKSVLPASERERLLALDDAALQQELIDGLRLTAASLMRLACIVRILEERGKDLSDLRIGLLSYLRKIAYGQVLAEVVVRFAEHPDLMRRVSQLPIPDQERLASGEPIQLAVWRVGGGTDHRMVDPLSLTKKQIGQVFGPARLRPLHEQIVRMEAKRPAPPREPTNGHTSSIVRPWLRSALRNNGSIDSPKAKWLPGDTRATLNGDFTAAELQVIVDRMSGCYS